MQPHHCCRCRVYFEDDGTHSEICHGLVVGLTEFERSRLFQITQFYPNLTRPYVISESAFLNYSLPKHTAPAKIDRAPPARKQPSPPKPAQVPVVYEASAMSGTAVTAESYYMAPGHLMTADQINQVFQRCGRDYAGALPRARKRA